MSIQHHIQLRPSFILTYQKCTHSKKGNHKNSIKALKENKDERFNKAMSSTQSKKIRRISETWLTSISITNSKDYIPTFITLTLPGQQLHDDKEIKRQCLTHWITKAKRGENLVKYVWKAEKQKNGNIHFHVFGDKRYDKEKLSKDWNDVINKLGYVDRYQEKMSGLNYEEYKATYKRKYKEEKMRRAYENGKACNWTKPPTTNITKVRSQSGVVKYLSKYMSKAGKGEIIQGRAYGCSDELKELKYCSLMLEDIGLENVIKDLDPDGLKEMELLTGNQDNYWFDVNEKFCRILKTKSNTEKILLETGPYLHDVYTEYHKGIYEQIYA